MKKKNRALLSISDIDNHYNLNFLGRCFLKLKHASRFKCPVVTEWGLNRTPREPQLIVSLTSIPFRIHSVHKTLATLLTQTLKPDLLVLWLAEEEFPDKQLPETLTSLQNFGLAINWCSNLRSYKKLVPSLKNFPDAIIVTTDDDLYYRQDTLALLYNSYLQKPRSIHVHRTGLITWKDGQIKARKHFDYAAIEGTTSYFNRLSGSGTVLYPPHALDKEILQTDKFLTLIPTHDDVGFWAMAVLNHTPTTVVIDGNHSLDYVENTQEHGLVKVNRTDSGLPIDQAYRRIIRAYPKIAEILSAEVLPNFPIDLVYLWCDSSDPFWYNKQQEALKQQTNPLDADAAAPYRYANHDELKYALRSAEQCAPWINNIYIITDHQVPQWLNTKHPKVHLINHEEILPSTCLPTFNSRAIEACLHKIPHLTEHFLYANDDMFFWNPVQQADFFTHEGLPITRLGKRIWPKTYKHLYGHAIKDMYQLINTRFSLNLPYFPYHGINAYSKTVFQECTEHFASEFRQTMQQKFRERYSIQRVLISYYMMAKYQTPVKHMENLFLKLFKPGETGYLECLQKNLRDGLNLRTKLLCINQGKKTMEEDIQAMRRLLKLKFPHPSAFEL